MNMRASIYLVEVEWCNVTGAPVRAAKVEIVVNSTRITDVCEPHVNLIPVGKKVAFSLETESRTLECLESSSARFIKSKWGSRLIHTVR